MNISSIIQEIMPFLQTYGLLIIFLGVLLEGEFRIIIAGILCQQGTLALGETIAVAIVSAFLSDQIWFQLGRHYGQSLLNRFPFLVKHQHKIQPWVKTKSDTIAFAGRFIYGTRIIGYLILGLHNYSLKRFMLIDSMVATSWCLLGIALGYFLGSNTDRLFGEIQYIEKLLLLIVVLGLSWYGYKARKNKNKLDQQEQ
jgi:membrane protein DedA with SNARE-associated domain